MKICLLMNLDGKNNVYNNKTNVKNEFEIKLGISIIIGLKY